MPLRALFERSQDFTRADTILPDGYSMTDRLPALILRIALRQHEDELPVWTEALRWPRMDRWVAWGSEAHTFDRFVKRFIRNVRLEDRGEYPAFARLLLDPALPHVFTILHRMARQRSGRPTNAVELSTQLRDRVHQYFRDYEPELYGSDRRVITLFDSVVSIWVGEELLMAALRLETGEVVDDAASETGSQRSNPDEYHIGYNPEREDAWGGYTERRDGLMETDREFHAGRRRSRSQTGRRRSISTTRDDWTPITPPHRYRGSDDSWSSSPYSRSPSPPFRGIYLPFTF
jgi:hypothetical protein